MCVNLNDGKVGVQLNLELRKSAARLKATDDSQSELTYRKRKLKPTQSCFCVLKKGANQRVRGVEMLQVSWLTLTVTLQAGRMKQPNDVFFFNNLKI